MKTNVIETEEKTMRKFFSQLKNEKIKINRNKNPIRMELFLSFLTIETQKETEFLGCSNGWTKYTGDNNLIISGANVEGVEYLHKIMYGENLDNSYNNYVNPFYLLPIMTDEGKRFFLQYYSKEIKELKDIAERNLAEAREYNYALNNFWQNISELRRSE